MPFRQQRRRDKADCCRVEAIHQHDDEAHCKHKPLKARERVLIDERLYIDSPGLFHCILTDGIELPASSRQQLAACLADLSGAKIKSAKYGQQPGEARTRRATAQRAASQASRDVPGWIEKTRVSGRFDDVGETARAR